MLRCPLTSIGNPIVEIRRSYDSLISTMGFTKLVEHFIMVSQYIIGLVQERHNSIANAMELCLSCTNPSILRNDLPRLSCSQYWLNLCCAKIPNAVQLKYPQPASMLQVKLCHAFPTLAYIDQHVCLTQQNFGGRISTSPSTMHVRRAAHSMHVATSWAKKSVVVTVVCSLDGAAVAKNKQGSCEIYEQIYGSL